MPGILAVGEVLIDFTPYGLSDKGNPLFEQNPGGAPANVAAMVSKLGGEASLAAKVGRDGFGEVLARTLEEIGVDASRLVVTGEANTTLAFVHLDDDGERSFSFYRKPGADALLEVTDIPNSAIEAADLLHAGSVSLTKEPARSATLSAVRRAATMGKAISFDPNIREKLIGDLDRLLFDIRGILPFVRYLKVAEEELELIADEPDVEIACRALNRQFGIPVIIVTRGSRGSMLYAEGRFSEVPGFPVRPVDATGAGDAFWGAFLYRLTQGGFVENIPGVPALIEFCRFAGAAGALACTKRGGIPALPNLEEINGFMSGKGQSR
ncbi:carbohydrate kinase family protein [Bhargavaea beijingensis]|uniref:Carbohydrate kinase n=1 Tax=Bhargavaea beijingensis TaxID=426756 RepID=A0ABX9ZF93_9BACL|nr:carbohydrate kinase [Bhargavaea beijingensis]RSK35635.1 carbohydrate kinase [Bhargavaea beijingensis]